MAKAGTDNGRRRLHGAALEIVRKHTAAEAVFDRSRLNEEERSKEEALRSLADVIQAAGVRGRVKKEMTDGKTASCVHDVGSSRSQTSVIKTLASGAGAA